MAPLPYLTIIKATLNSAIVVSSALVLVVFVGVPTAFLVTRLAKRSRFWCDTIFTVPMVLPPTAIGFGLIWIFGRSGFVGGILDSWFGFTVLFNRVGAVLAAGVVAFPLVYRSSRASFDGVDGRLEDAARTLKAGELGIFFRVSLPLARRGILVGAILGFARAIGEFGATLMVAGNIPGRTQTLPLAIYQAVQVGDGKMGLVLCCVSAVFGVAALVAVQRMEPKKGRGV